MNVRHAIGLAVAITIALFVFTQMRGLNREVQEARASLHIGNTVQNEVLERAQEIRSGLTQ